MGLERLRVHVTAERLLFRAGRKGYAYPELLEVRRGSLRILVPSGEAKRRARVVSTLVAIAYVFVAGPVIATIAVALMQNLGAVAAVPTVVVYFLGFVGILVWWDRWSLPLLAENPSAAIPIEFVGTQSFGTFQEIRGRIQGADVRVSIPGSRARLDDAVRFAGLSANSPIT